MDDANKSPIIVGGAVRGEYHADGEQCEDAYRVEELPSGVAFAVGDGLGSAAYSAEGSRLATRQAVEVMVENTSRLVNGEEQESSKVMTEACWAGFVALTHKALQRDAAFADLSTTIHAGFLSEEGRLVYGHLGDGAMISRKGENSEGADEGKEEEGPSSRPTTLEVVASPQGFAHRTPALTSKGAFHALETGIVGGVEEPVLSVAAFTDGITKFAIDEEGTPRASFIGEILQINRKVALKEGEEAASEKLTRFLESKKIASKTSDDRTLLSINRNP